MTLSKILIIGVVALLTLVGFQANHTGNLKRTIDQQASINKELKDSVTTYKNRYGEEVAKRAAAEADRELLKQTYGEQFDWIKKHMGINEKNVKGIFNVVTTTKNSGIATENPKLPIPDTLNWVSRGDYDRYDSTKWIPVSDENRWFRLDGFMYIPEKNFIYSYHVYDSIRLVPYKEGKSTFVKGISYNPNTTITGLQGILVATEPKKKRWGIGPSVQVGYDTEIRITPGVSVQYSLIRF